MKRLALVAAMTLALGACQGEQAPPPAPAPEPAPAPMVEPVAAPQTAPAVSGEIPVMDQAFATKLNTVLASDTRGTENKARDGFRHPRETLSFLGIAPGMTVIEVNPGAGWYTEILAPLLKDSGTLVTAVVDPLKTSSDRAREYSTQANADLRTMLGEKIDSFGPVQVVEYDPAAPMLGLPGSADMVLTFRSTHGWVRAGNVDAMFRGFFDVLKPGAVLGVEQHRAAAGSDPVVTAPSGYVAEAHVIELAQAAGFVLDGSSDVNANPADTRDHPEGVWSLPPNLAGNASDEEKARLTAIGESDRMTLRFRKPAEAAAMPAAAVN